MDLTEPAQFAGVQLYLVGLESYRVVETIGGLKILPFSGNIRYLQKAMNTRASKACQHPKGDMRVYSSSLDEIIFGKHRTDWQVFNNRI